MPRNSAGGILLVLALTIFILSLIGASGVLYALWRDSDRSVGVLWQLVAGNRPVSRPTPTVSHDSLAAPLMLTPVLEKERAELEKQLRSPLRAYYATQAEQLLEIAAEPAEDGEHTSHVTLTVRAEGTVRQHTFFFDRTGKEHDGPYPSWEPAMLDTAE